MFLVAGGGESVNQLLPVYSAKFMRPRLAKHVISRPKVLGKLREAAEYPLTLVTAGAGYGKSTVMNQAFPESQGKSVWLHLSEQDRSVHVFLLQLFRAVQRAFPDAGHKTREMLTWEDRQGSLDPFAVLETFMTELEEAVTEPLILVVDDYQYLENQPDILRLTEVLVEWLPENIHLIIASREKVQLPGLALKRAQGMVLEVEEQDLAFKDYEIMELFRQFYGLEVEPGMAGRLVARTEGWIMAIHMLGQHMKKGGSWDSALSSLPQSISELFEYLAQEYLYKQSNDIFRFLRYTAHLTILKAEDCNHIAGISNSGSILREMGSKGLFTFHIGEGLYRYHHLFQEFIQKTAPLSAAELTDLHHRAAVYYQRIGVADLAIEHFLSGGDYREAGQAIKDIYQERIGLGQYADLERWLAQMPPVVIHEIPELLLCRGDICRLSGDFSGALNYYTLAEKGFAENRTMAGAYLVAKAFALIYLDTVQPVLAARYLEAALSLVETASIREKARLYQLMAENEINRGQPEAAADLFRKANELFLEDSRGDIEARMHLRTGRLVTAKNILQRQAEASQLSQMPKSHREAPLLLALINAFVGDAEDALANAQLGLDSGVQRKAAFVEAIGYMRLGHAKQLMSWLHLEEAAACYQQALDICSDLGVERGKAEPLFGLCLLHGHHHNLDSAIRYGMEGLRVGQQAKDDWIAAMSKLSLAIAFFKCGVSGKAQEWLGHAYESFVKCGDSYLATVSLLWKAKMMLESNQEKGFREAMDALLINTQSHDYDFIFYKPTLLGLRDSQEAMPLLQVAQRHNIRADYVGSLLTELGAAGADASIHPGYTLRVQAFGQFKVWRGLDEIRSKEWQREKAKHLFQYLITNRKRLVHKEQLVEELWGENGGESDFKVAMNALITALEPNRPARSTPFYINRHNAAYGLNRAAGVLVDVDEFESYINRGSRIMEKDPEQAIRLFRMALNHYKGDFLQECCYEDWSMEERERLLILYITTAEKMGWMLYERGEYEECISICTRIIAKHRCWESAYCLLMRCYHRQNNRSMVKRIFSQCQEYLQGELGVRPAPETSGLYTKLMNGTD